MPGYALSSSWRYIALLAASVLLAVALSACSGSNPDATSEKVLTLEAKIHSLEESLESVAATSAAVNNELTAVQEQNAELSSELAALRQQLADKAQPAESTGGRKEPQSPSHESIDARLRALEEVASQITLFLPVLESWFTGMDKRVKELEGSDLERTVQLVEAAGGEVHYINHSDREEPAILAAPPGLPEGSPLIVSLHGFSGDSAGQITYVPLHQHMSQRGFGLLLPNGIRNAEGNRFWNPTDQCCEGGKSGEDDYAYLSHIVAEAHKLKGFGPVYFFGYSNGGFMSYWMACQGLPGLRAVASLAGTSYMDDALCEGAAPVSVLHVHGTSDAVVLFDGAGGGTDSLAEAWAGYAAAGDMARNWGERAGCHWPEDEDGDALRPGQPYATLDLDEYVPGAETQAYRLESGCTDGISIELWVGEGGSHGPGYGDAFTDALLDWLLAQE